MRIVRKMKTQIMMGQNRQTSDTMTEHKEQDRLADGYVDEHKNESYLPSSVHGSPRHMTALARNALILVSEFGCPHVSLHSLAIQNGQRLFHNYYLDKDEHAACRFCHSSNSI